jgi:hypothetical protein
MQPDALAPLIPVAAIIMFGLVRISRHWRPGALPQSPTEQLEERLNTVERDIASLQGELSETQERLDFAERMLAQTREPKRLE